MINNEFMEMNISFSLEGIEFSICLTWIIILSVQIFIFNSHGSALSWIYQKKRKIHGMFEIKISEEIVYPKSKKANRKLKGNLGIIFKGWGGERTYRLGQNISKFRFFPNKNKIILINTLNDKNKPKLFFCSCFIMITAKYLNI